MGARIWHVGGFDLSVLRFIECDTGVIVVDPFTTKETVAGRSRCTTSVRGECRVRAIVDAHSHIDHFGGLKGHHQRTWTPAPWSSRRRASCTTRALRTAWRIIRSG
jgi:alkyl sulfatase BDS1-like metallo-beta-lactamase superfamily hydrolase